MLYFAYGSNLEWAQMKKRCPSARFVSLAKLPDHRLAFTRKSKDRGCGVADAIPAKGHDMWGVVYEINERDIGQLDKSEGFQPDREREKNSYIREELHVFEVDDGKKPLIVSTYFAIKEPSPPLPSKEYMRQIVEGAKYWHIPSNYIEELEKIEVEE